MVGHLIHRNGRGFAVGGFRGHLRLGLRQTARGPPRIGRDDRLVVRDETSPPRAGCPGWPISSPRRRGRAFSSNRSAVFQAVTVVLVLPRLGSSSTFSPDESRSWAYVLIFGVGAIGGVLDILLHISIPEPPRGRSPPASREPISWRPLRGPQLPALRLGDWHRAARLEPSGAPSRAPYVTSPEAVGAANVWARHPWTVISQLTWVAIAPLWGFLMGPLRGASPVVLMGYLVGLATLG